MNALVTRAPTGAALAAWVDNADRNMAAIPSSGGLPLLKLTKAGVWVFGQKQTPLADNDFVAVNPFSAEVGFIAFSDAGELQGEQMVSLSAPSLRRDQLPQLQLGPKDKGWQQQVAVACQIVDGQNAGTAVVYKTSSVGGMDFAKRLIADMMAKLRAGDEKCVPVLDLQVDSYQHSNRSYGTIYTPQYNIVSWTAMGFDPPVESEDAPFEADAPAAAAPARPAPRPTPRPKDQPSPQAVHHANVHNAPEPGRRMRRA